MHITIARKEDAVRRVAEQVKSFKSTLAYAAPEVMEAHWKLFDERMKSLAAEIWTSSENLHTP